MAKPTHPDLTELERIVAQHTAWGEALERGEHLDLETQVERDNAS